MKTWPPHIERFRTWVQWECRDIPVDLVLAIIAHESGGRAGIEAARTCKSAIIPSDGGGEITANRAMGLMQIIPSHVNSWNVSKAPKITYQDMTGQDERAARLQIRLGCSIFASYVYRLNKFDPVAFPGSTPGTATENQLNLALVAYAIGPGKPGGKKGVIPRLEKLKTMGKPMTLKELSKAFPKWGYSEDLGKWINRPVQYGLAVWGAYKNTKPGAIASIGNTGSNQGPSLFPLAMMLAAAFALTNTSGILGNLGNIFQRR